MLWGGWGERKRERAGHDGKGEERHEEPHAVKFLSRNFNQLNHQS